ncbi:putative signal peptide protein [Puccinia sorghi]|uniref:Putative signal peptide protein n=1 Tax=Puccinia sorghi TaxID=27349 RepID=A0A0L6VTW5_9BASI|nr:putative signal peptide protein [Puccinia sorghi]
MSPDGRWHEATELIQFSSLMSLVICYTQSTAETDIRRWYMYLDTTQESSTFLELLLSSQSHHTSPKHLKQAVKSPFHFHKLHFTSICMSFSFFSFSLSLFFFFFFLFFLIFLSCCSYVCLFLRVFFTYGYEANVEISFLFLLIPELHLFSPSSISTQSSYTVAFESLYSSHFLFILFQNHFFASLYLIYITGLNTSNIKIGSSPYFSTEPFQKGPLAFFPFLAVKPCMQLILLLCSLCISTKYSMHNALNAVKPCMQLLSVCICCYWESWIRNKVLVWVSRWGWISPTKTHTRAWKTNHISSESHLFFFPPQKMSHSCFHSPPSLSSNLPRLLCCVCDFVLTSLSTPVSTKSKHSLHNQTYFFTWLFFKALCNQFKNYLLFNCRGYQLNLGPSSPKIRLNLCTTSNKHTTGMISVYDQVQRRHLHASQIVSIQPVWVFWKLKVTIPHEKINHFHGGNKHSIAAILFSFQCFLRRKFPLQSALSLHCKKKLAQLPAVEMQKLPGSFCSYSNLSQRLIQPRFDAQSLFTLVTVPKHLHMQKDGLRFYIRF